MKKKKMQEKLNEPSEEDLHNPLLYKYIKHKPIKTKKSDNQIYIKRNSNKNRILKKCENFFLKNERVKIIGLGSSISKAISFSLEVEKRYDGLRISPITNTIQLIDEYQPLKPNYPSITQIRNNSSIEITLSKIQYKY